MHTGLYTTYEIKLWNRDTSIDRFTLSSAGYGSGDYFDIRYYDALSGGVDITDGVIAGTYSVALAPGGAKDLRMEATAKPAAVIPWTKEVLLTATSTVDSAQNDYVDMQTTLQAIAKMQYSLDAGTSWADVLASPLMVDRGATVQFKAIRAASSAGWPAGKPLWTGPGGATSVEESRTFVFSQVAASSTDTKPVSVECGNTVTALVLVYDATVKVKRADSTSALSSNAIVVIGGKTAPQHTANVEITVAPVLSGATIAAPRVLNGDGINGGSATLTMNSLVTDSLGKVTGTYKSSNRLQTATIGVNHDGSNQATLSQHWDDLGDGHPDLWQHPAYFDYDVPATVTFTPKYTDDNGASFKAILGHSMTFKYTSAVVLKWNGSSYDTVTYPVNAQGQVISQVDTTKKLAEFTTASNSSPSTGEYRANVLVHWLADQNGGVAEIVQSITFSAEDNDAYN